jgi:hypothetical protein
MRKTRWNRLTNWVKSKRTNLHPPLTDVVWGRKLITGLVLFMVGMLLILAFELWAWLDLAPRGLYWSVEAVLRSAMFVGVCLITQGHASCPRWQWYTRWTVRVGLSSELIAVGLGCMIPPYTVADQVPMGLAWLSVWLPLVASVGTIALMSHMVRLSDLFRCVPVRRFYVVFKWLCIFVVIRHLIKLLIAWGDHSQLLAVHMQQVTAATFCQYPRSRESAAHFVPGDGFVAEGFVRIFYSWLRMVLIYGIPSMWLGSVIASKFPRTSVASGDASGEPPVE